MKAPCLPGARDENLETLATMDAFNSLGNHLVSDSGPTIKASDDMSSIVDESMLAITNGSRRRRHDDDASEAYEEDDLESLASAAIGGPQLQEVEEVEKELPPHACV